MIYAHKILPLLLSPIFIVIYFICIGFFSRNHKWGVFAILLLYISSIPLTSDIVFRLTERNSVRRDITPLPKSDALVILSGMMLNTVPSESGFAYEWNDSDRFLSGVELFKKGVARKLVFTGGFIPWQNHLESEGDILKRYAMSLGIHEADIVLTQHVLNTEQEALAIKSSLGSSGNTLILVTSAFHMSRAAMIFRNNGFVVHEFPVDFRVNIRTRTPMDFLPSALGLYNTSLAIREQIGLFYYYTKYTFSIYYNRDH